MNTSRRNALKYLGKSAAIAPIVGLGIAVALGPSALEKQRKLARVEPTDTHPVGLGEHLRTLNLQRAFRETALSLLETRAATGSFPDQPVLASDPYAANKTLGYRREGDGCTLWSVGPNRIDDGGVGLSADRRMLDLVVRL